MKKFKLITAGIIALAMVGCGSDDVKKGDTVHLTQFALDGAKSENNGTIDFDSGDNGLAVLAGDIHGTKHSKYTNNGIIKGSHLKIGMEATKFGTVTNSNSGVINLTKDGAIGMKAINSGQASNHGNINLNGSNQIGMLADGGTVTNEIDGTITLRGTQDSSQGQSITDTKEFTNTTVGHDNHGNVGMKAVNGGKIINKGKIIFKNQ